MNELLQSIAEEYWIKKLRSAKPVSLFHNLPVEAVGEEQEQTFVFPESLAQKLTLVAKGKESGISLILLSVLQSLVYKYSGQSNILVATGNLPTRKTGDGAVYFNSYFEADTTPRKLLAQNLVQGQECTTHTPLSQSYLAERLPETETQQALRQIGFFYAGYHAQASHLESVQLLFCVISAEDAYTLHIRYQPVCYTAAQVQQLGEQYMVWLHLFLTHTDQPFSTLHLLSEADEQHILTTETARFSQGTTRTLLEMWHTQAQQTPDAEAVHYKSQRYTYQEIDTRAEALAHYLTTHHQIQPGDAIGLMLTRSEYLIISLLAILKVGAVFVPLEPSFPRKRKQYMLEDAGIRLLLINSEQLFEVQDYYTGELVAVDLASPPPPPQEGELNPVPSGTIGVEERLSNSPSCGGGGGEAYILYTSGSTGQPKGVKISQQSIANYIQWANRYYFGSQPAHRFALCTAITFDLTLTSLFSSLLSGGGLTIIEEKPVDETLKEVFAQRSEVTAVKLTPSHVTVLAELGLTATHIRSIILGGEALHPHHIETLQRLNPQIRIFNEYGPTEATVGCTVKEITSPLQVITIGTPVDGASIYILDENRCILPPGTVGEIAISGVGLALGYHNQPEQTAQRFIDLSLNHKENSFRVYLSGDLGVQLPDGELLYLGRKDNQVKIRGFRIETDEIEQALRTYPGIQDVVVMAVTSKKESTTPHLEGTALAAYFTARHPIEPAALRTYLSSLLPDYMLPAYWIPLEKFPINAHGKTDRAALPSPTNVQTNAAGYVAPETPLEQALADIWEDVLERSPIGVTEGFFTLGGDSIKAIRVCNQIQQRMGEIVHITLLFEAPTIRQLAQRLESYRQLTTSAMTDEKIITFTGSIPVPKLFTPRVPKNKSAVFILSSPRAGSTLFRSMLAGHPQLFAPPELELLFFNTLADRKRDLDGPHRLFLEGTIRAIMQLKDCTAEEATDIMRRLEEQEVTVQDFYQLLQEWMDGKMLVDKSPNYAFSLPVLQRIEDFFEEPRYLFLIRHPYGMIHSFEKAKMDQIFRFSNPFGLRELAELVWLVSYQNIRKHLETIPAHRKHTVHYEELVEQPHEVVQGVCQFLDIPFEEAMLRIHDHPAEKMLDGLNKDSKMIGDVKFWQHTHINPASAHTWKKAYPDDFLSPVTWQLAQRLGYTPPHPVWERIEPVPAADLYEPSYAQNRIWLAAQLEQEQISYNVCGNRILEDIEPAVLQQAYQALIRRHESLRTVFVEVDGRPMQRILPWSLAFEMTVHDLRTEADIQAKALFFSEQETHTPLDLANGPMIRARLLQVEDRQFVLLFTLHHIISDGWTMDVLFRDLTALYESYRMHGKDTLLPLRIQYKDFAAWEHRQLQGESLERHRTFWLDQLRGTLPVLDMPLDFPRPAVMTYHGVTTTVHLEDGLRQQLRQLSQQNQATPFMTLLAVVQALLYRYTGQQDILVGSPFAGRSHPDLENQVGVFINMLVYRAMIGEEETFQSLLTQVRERVIGAYDHQLYPFDQLFKDLGLTRDPSRSPLFDVNFTFQNLGMAAHLTEADVMAHGEADALTENSKFDLTLIFVEYEKGIVGYIKYNRDLFTRETIEVFKKRFVQLLEQVITQPSIPLADIAFATEKNTQPQLKDSFTMEF